jgi:hypothetical protein
MIRSKCLNRFDLALSLGKLQDAFEIAKEKKNPNKYKQIGDIALAKGFYAIAEESYKACEDIYSLFFLYSNICNYDGVKWVQSLAKERGAANIEFLCAYLLKDAKECLAIIAKAERWPEATFFAKAYIPENVPEYLAKWKRYIEGSSKINQCNLLIRLHPC